jgi:hypothetical protein
VEPSVEAVRGLRDKYREMKALRVEHARGEPADPRPRLRALAQRFPGALRELDELPMELIEARLRALDEALAAGPPFSSRPWIALQAGYHALMRAALRVKRLSRGRRGAALEAVLQELSGAAHAGALDEPPLDRAAVALILDPPGGRLGPWVLSEVARREGVDPETVRRALFVRPR